MVDVNVPDAFQLFLGFFIRALHIFAVDLHDGARLFPLAGLGDRIGLLLARDGRTGTDSDGKDQRNHAKQDLSHGRLLILCISIVN